MLVEINKVVKTTETVELALPAFFKNGSYSIKVEEDKIVKLDKTFCIIYPKEAFYFSSELKQIVSEAQPSDEETFNNTMDLLLETLKQTA